MKRHLLPATTLAAVLVLLVFVPSIAVSQSPTGGAQLRITGTVNSTFINVAINDGNIQSGTTRTSPCDGMMTNAYVLQGGSPTGCDNADDFETTQGTGSATLSGTGFNFTVTTLYCTTTPAPASTELACVSSTNSNGTVTASPDTGFLTVTNSSGAAFTGSITLTGTSPGQGGIYCPPIGLASDSFSGTLVGSGTWTFALSPDSSNCGGFTPPLTKTLAAGDGVTSYTYPVGDSLVDTFVFTPINNVAGDMLTITPVLVARSGTPPPPVFTPGGTFSTFSCVPYKDFTDAVGPDECVEFHATCVGADCAGTNPFFYQVQLHYDLAAGVGGIGLLKADGGCPTNTFDTNILTSYSASLDPIISGGDLKKSCFVSTFNPNATGGAVTDYQTFVGFQSPVSNTTTNFIKAGKSEPLIWQQFQIDPNTGGVVPNNTMKLCTTYPTTPCTGNTVAVQTYPVACPGGAKILTNKFPGNSSLQFFGNGIYDFNLKTASGDTGCFKVALIYGSTGVQFPPALFQFK